MTKPAAAARGPLTRGFGALAVVLALGLAAPATALPAPAGGGAGTSAGLALLDRTAWVGDGTDFLLSVQVADAPADAQLRLLVHDRIRSRSEFARSLDGLGLRREVHRSAAVPVADIDPEADGLLTIGVPLVEREGVERVSIAQPGVYPVVLELLDGDGEPLATLRTHLVRLAPFDAGSEAQPLDVVVVVPLHAPPTHLTAVAPTAPDLPLAELAAVLGAHPDVPLTLAPTPETVAAAAESDPPAVEALAAAAAHRQVLAAPWVALDEAAWARADPRELSRQLDRGRRALVGALGVEPDGTRVLPEGAPPSSLATMVDQGADAVIVAEAALGPLEGEGFPFTLTRPFALAVGDDGDADADGRETVPALVADAALAGHAGAALADPVLAAHHLLADLAVLASDQPAFERVATVVLPPTAAGSPAFLRALLTGLEPPAAPPAPAPPTPTFGPDGEPIEAPVQAPAIPAAAPVVVGRTARAALDAVEPAGAEGLPDPEDPLVRTLVGDTPVSRVGAVAERLVTARADIVSYRSTFGEDDPLARRLDELVASLAAAELDTATRDAALARVDGAIEAQLAGLHGPERQQVTLTAREGRLQLLLTNDTGRPAEVTLIVRGDRLVLPDAPGGRIHVELVEPSTRVELRVEARSSGDAPLDVRMTTADERIELGQSRITVRTTAVSGVGVALMVAAAAFLAIWWTRTILRERRATRTRHPAHAHARAGT